MSDMWSTTSATASGGYYGRPNYVRRKLKSLFILQHEFDFKQDFADEWEDEHRNWLINQDMVGKFGDGNYYSFELSRDNDDYTHTYNGYYYHELWFIEHRDDRIINPAPIMKLDEEDFIL